MRERLQSLDAFRGITIAGMILVNNAGDWDHVFSQLEHAEWNGCTATDLVFPFFLFIVGVAITLALERRRGEGSDERALLLQIARRTAILFALGLLLNAFPFNLPRALRIPGVLQRIALAYAAAAVLALKTAPRTQSVVAVALLAGYWAALALVPVPGYGAWNLTPEGNLGAWIDRTLLPGHTWKPGWDPEGLLSTVPAVSTTLSGVLAGRWLCDASRPGFARACGLFAAGLACAVAGLVANAWFPINKNLWTSSYVLFTSGLALQALAACYWAIDLQGAARGARPFVIFGKNPIAAFVLSSLLARALVYAWKVEGPLGKPITAKQWIYEHTFGARGSNELASLLYALAYLLLWLGVMAIFDRKKIYLKV